MPTPNDALLLLRAIQAGVVSTTYDMTKGVLRKEIDGARVGDVVDMFDIDLREDTGMFLTDDIRRWLNILVEAKGQIQ